MQSLAFFARKEKPMSIKKDESKYSLQKDISNSVESSIDQVLVPKFMDLISDFLVDIVQRFFGKGSATRSSDRRRSGYGDYYDRGRDRSVSDRKVDGPFNYEEVICDTKQEVEEVLDRLQETIDRYDVASINDLYKAAKLPLGPYTYGDYGWESLRDVKRRPTSDGRYIIRMPRPTNLRRGRE